MWKAICASVLLIASASAHADGCALPSADSGAPYVALAALPRRELQLLLSEYMFVHRWTTHSEAVSAGFRYGDRVYGEGLKPGARFSAASTAAWRRAYEHSGRKQFLAALAPKVDIAAVDRSVVDWVLGACLASAVWSQVKASDDCRFTFSAGLTSSDVASPTVRPTKLKVHGGRCERWPKRPLSVKGDAIQCVRSGDAAVTVELNTDRAGLTRQTLPGLQRADVSPEPVQESRLSDPRSEVLSLSRSHDYRLRRLGTGCPTCALYAADIGPSDPDAVILQATTVSSSGAGWHACPAGLRCGVYEFSPPDNARLSGCTGLHACRVWRLAETDAEASDVIQLTYQKSEAVCVNCPLGVEFGVARRQWQEARDKARPRCQVVEDSPPQWIEPARRN